jgi:pyruvate/2-oxoglutarate dehydrogenase complex dihydrolipoamide acyltransferase (E2) component
MRIPYQRLVISLILFVLCFVPLAACGTTAPEEPAPTTGPDTEDASATQAAASAPTAAPASAPAAPTSAAPADFASPAFAGRLTPAGFIDVCMRGTRHGLLHLSIRRGQRLTGDMLGTRNPADADRHTPEHLE